MNTIKITQIKELEEAFTIRRAVFIEEQEVPAEEEFDEFDQLDSACEHILVYYDGKPVGTGRVRLVGEVGKLERICILQPYRKFGLGKLIIQKLEELAKDMGVNRVKLHGQTQAEGFYHKIGYETASDPFMEADIPHVLMMKTLSK